MVYLLPTIRNELNIPTVITETIFSPVLYNIERQCDLGTTEQLVQGIKAATLRKAAVTDPTVVLREWALKIVQPLSVLQGQDQWRALPILSGLLLAVKEVGLSGGRILHGSFLVRVQQMLVDYSNSSLKFYSERHINSSALQIQVVILSMAMTCRHLDRIFLDPLASKVLLINTVDFVYQSPFILNPDFRLGSIAALDLSLSPILNSPPFSHLNLFSLLNRVLIQSLHSQDVGLILETNTIVSEFASSLSSKYAALETSLSKGPVEVREAVWRYLKLSLFSVLLPLEGTLNWLLQNVAQSEFREHGIGISEKMLQVLFELHFIVTQMSLSGFTLFNFVYSTCIDILLDNRFCLQPVHMVLQRQTSSFLDHELPNLTRIVFDSVLRSKLIFFLNFCESIAPLAFSLDSDWQFVMEAISPFLRPPLQPQIPPTIFKSIMEAAHSAYLSMLSSLTLPQSASHEILGVLDVTGSNRSQNFQRAKNLQFLDAEVSRYLDCVLSLFPAVFSATQLLLAVNTIISCMSSPSILSNNERAECLLDEIVRKSTLEPCLPLPNVSADENGSLSDPYSYPTIRSVHFCALIHSISIIDNRLFEKWLEKTWRLIQHLPNNSSPFWTQEQQFLKHQMFQMISTALDQYRSSIAIRWWYKVQGSNIS